MPPGIARRRTSTARGKAARGNVQAADTNAGAEHAPPQSAPQTPLPEPHPSCLHRMRTFLRGAALFWLKAVPGADTVIDDMAGEPAGTALQLVRRGFHRWLMITIASTASMAQLLAALIAPVSTLLVIPAMSQPWYKHRHTQADVPDPTLNIVLSAINLGTNSLANAFLLVRFSVADRKIWKVAIHMSLILWIVNLGFAITNLAVFASGGYRDLDIYEYREGFWCAVWSTIAAGSVTLLLLFHYAIRFGIVTYQLRQEAIRASIGQADRSADDDAASDSCGSMEPSSRDHRQFQKEAIDKWDMQQRERDARVSIESRTFLLSQASLFFSLGIFGFMFSRLEHWAFYDGVHFLLIVTLTVGYGVSSPLSTASKILLLPTALICTMLLYNQIGTIVGVLNRLRTKRRNRWRQKFETQIELDEHKMICELLSGENITQELKALPPPHDVHWFTWRRMLWDRWHGDNPAYELVQRTEDDEDKKVDQGPNQDTFEARVESSASKAPLDYITSILTMLQNPLFPQMGDELMEVEIMRLNAMTDRENAELASSDLVFSIVLMIAFLVIGAAIFQATEDWSYGDALYFSYISVLTIGLGDYTPKSAAGKVVWLIYALTAVPIVTSFVVQTIANLVQAGAQRISASQSMKIVQILKGDEVSPAVESIPSQGTLLTRFHKQTARELGRLFGPREFRMEYVSPGDHGDQSETDDYDTPAEDQFEDCDDMTASRHPHGKDPFKPSIRHAGVAADRSVPDLRHVLSDPDGDSVPAKKPSQHSGSRALPDNPPPASFPYQTRVKHTETSTAGHIEVPSPSVFRTHSELGSPSKRAVHSSEQPSLHDQGSTQSLQSELNALEQLICSQRLLLSDMLDTVHVLDGMTRALLLHTLDRGSDAWTVVRADMALCRRTMHILEMLDRAIPDGNTTVSQPVPKFPLASSHLSDSNNAATNPRTKTHIPSFDADALEAECAEPSGNASKALSSQPPTDAPPPRDPILDSTGSPHAAQPISKDDLSVWWYESLAKEKFRQILDRMNLISLTPTHAHIEGKPTLNNINRMREAFARISVFGEELERVSDTQSSLLAQARARNQPHLGQTQHANTLRAQVQNKTSDRNEAPSQFGDDGHEQRTPERQLSTDQLVLREKVRLRQAYLAVRRQHEYPPPSGQPYPSAHNLLG